VIRAEIADSKGRKNFAELTLYAFTGLNRILYPSIERTSSNTRSRVIRLLSDKEEYQPGDTAHVS